MHQPATTTTTTTTHNSKRVLVLDAAAEEGPPALRVLTLDGRSSLNAKLRDALEANYEDSGQWQYDACTRSCVMGLVEGEGYVGSARGTRTEELWDFLAGDLSTGETDHEFDEMTPGMAFDYRVTIVGAARAPPPSCYCGADLSWFSSHDCSEGCDWAGITKALDNPDAALDSGCECGPRKGRRLLKQRKRRKA